MEIIKGKLVYLFTHSSSLGQKTTLLDAIKKAHVKHCISMCIECRHRVSYEVSGKWGKPSSTSEVPVTAPVVSVDGTH